MDGLYVFGVLFYFHFLDCAFIVGWLHHKKIALPLSAEDGGCSGALEQEGQFAESLPFFQFADEVVIDFHADCALPDEEEAAADVALLE